MATPSDLDIYRSASVLIDHHGADALYVAAARADEFLRLCNAEASSVWDRIAIAVQRIQANEPRAARASTRDHALHQSSLSRDLKPKEGSLLRPKSRRASSAQYFICTVTYS